ncbi:hypothetical protein IAQ61_001263 [Plenodomus lingam]|nr:hypothetical protein IAQ61_001263 [Plenodomus lingam]
MEGHQSAPFTSTYLETDWAFKQGDLTSSNEYAEANNLPTEIHRDLLKHGRIADPFVDLNEHSVRWVGDETWTYRTTFAAPPDHSLPNVTTMLKFEGLDTFATVHLNGEEILVSDNMFIEHRVDVSAKLKQEANVLEIIFESARKKGLELVGKHENLHRYIVHQTEISRGPVRKAQYHWGWDWGPILMTCGPWKPICLETYTTRLSDLWVNYELSGDLKSTAVKLSVQHDGPVEKLLVGILDTTTKEVIRKKLVEVNSQSASGQVEHTFNIDNLNLWWPLGYGSQHLYEVQVQAMGVSTSGDDIPYHSITQKLGFRKVELVQKPDGHGISFYFRINNIEIFCAGSCWIPADSFLTRITAQDYRDWVELTASGNQIMLRVWGGGIYEADALYNAADELGILIWQDFAFACANYPTHPSYLSSIILEATQAVRRLRHHPSLVIWAGNNEDYQIREKYNLTYDGDDHDPQSWLDTDFPARYIYEYLLPNLTRSESPQIPYHPSSPFGNGTSTVVTVDPTIGDIHQWNIWHGTMSPYQHLPDLGGRFVSEFGMESYPQLSSLRPYITDPDQQHPGSLVMDARNKAINHERRLLAYVAENFRLAYDLQTFAHLTQIMQADAMSWAYRGWRRQWGSGAPGSRQCGGVLVWQLNDCWPTISWAVVDYLGVPKPAFYAIKRAMAPVTVGVQRNFRSASVRPAVDGWQRETGHVDVLGLWERVEYAVWVADDGRGGEGEGEVEVRWIAVGSGRECCPGKKVGVRIVGNGVTEVMRDVIRTSAGDGGTEVEVGAGYEGFKCPFVIHVSLSINGKPIATDISWPEPIKYLSFPDRGISVRSSDDQSRVYVSAARPVKGFVFAERKGVRLSDNGFDVVPGVVVEVSVEGCRADELAWRYVNM